MKDPKIILTINLEGALSHETESVLIPYVKHNDKGTEIIKTGFVKHLNRKNKKCVQNWKLSEETYKDMISDYVPSFYKAKKNNNRHWHNLSINERIYQHCTRLADQNSFSFVVIE